MVVGELEIRIMADIARLTRDMGAARRIVTETTESMSRAAATAKAAVGGIASGIGLHQIVQMVDQYQKYTAQLKLATNSEREYAVARADVQRIARSAQQDLGATGVLYAKIANGTRELGVTQAQVAAITETVNMALKVSGATASESASAQLQLSQAFAAGALRGEEFNAVNEAAPRLMLALADGMGVPVGALKKMAEEGKITSAIMADVLPKALEKVREEAKQVQTIGGALTVLKNNAMEFFGVQANASGAVSALTGAIGMLADNLVLVAGAAATLTTAKLVTWLEKMVVSVYSSITANRALASSTLATAVATTEAESIAAAAKLAEAQANVRTTATAMNLANARVAELRTAVLAAEGEVALAIATNGLIPAQARALMLTEANTVALAAQAVAANGATVSATAHAAAVEAQATAATIGARAMGILNAATAFLGGPIAAVVTLLGLGATAWAIWGDKSKEGNDKATKSTEESTVEMIARLDKQIEKLRERNRLAETEPRIKSLTEMSDADKDGIARAQKALEAHRNSQNKPVAPYDHQFHPWRMEEQRLVIEYETALKRVGEAQEAVARGAKNTRDADLKEWYGKNGTAAQKMAAELDALKKKFGTIPPEMQKLVEAKYADKGAASAIKHEATAYQSLITSIQEKLAANKLELSGYEKLSESQKMTIKLDSAIGTGKNKLNAEHIKEARALIANVEAQERAIAAKQLAVKASEAAAKLDSENYDTLRASTAAIDDRIKQMEREIEMYGLSASAAIDMEKAKLEAKLALGPATYAELISLDEQIKKMEKLAGLAKNKEALDVSKKAVDDAAEDWKRATESMGQSLTDALLRGFESGKGFGRNFIDTIKNMFNTLVLRPIISAVVNPVAGAVTSGLGLAGSAQAAGSAASGASALGNAGGLLSGIGAASGAFGTGIMSGLSAWGAGGSVTGLLSSGTLFAGGIANGLGMVAGALGPIALALGAAVMIWKKLDTSGTYHAGGAASATSAGVTAVSASSLNMERIQANADTQKMVSQLAQGVVGILDSTALAFGKTAGYQAATAFADDTSKDGAWGSLVITKLGQSIVNWQDTRGNGKWAQKTFADGEKGQEQYLAALTASVRTALDSIGLPDWARTMLNGVASDASLDDLAKVVDQINKTQSALGAMRSQLAGFADMSDSAVSALMAAAGGIDALFSKASAYYDAFYTEAEKNSTVNEQIAKQLAAVNLQMPATKDGFRALVEAQMKLGPQGAESVSVLLGVAAAFAQMHPEAEAVVKSLEAQKSALTEAYNAEADALQATISRMGSFATTLRSVRDSALLGNLSPLSPQEKYAEAKAQYQAVLAAARNGDEGAQSNYQGAFTSFLEASRAVFASSSQYQADFAYAQAATAEAARWAELEADVGRAQLDVLKSQVSGIIEVNKSVLSVRDALLQYQAASGGNTMPLTAVAPPVNTPIPYSTYGAANTTALVAEIKGLRDDNALLRTEVSGLRAEQRQQTGDLIEAQFGAAEESSDKIADSVRPFKSLEYRVAPE